MKIRTGFVSNSSSSSFVVAGFKVEGLDTKQQDELIKILAQTICSSPNNYEDEWEYREDLEHKANIKVLSGYDDGFKDKEMVLGILLASSEYTLDEFSIDFDELTKKTKVIAEALKIPNKPTLFLGTKSC